MKNKLPNASEMGKIGGKKRFEQIGPEGMAEVGKKGNQAMQKLGENFYKERAKKIAESRKRKKKRSSLDKVASILSGE